MKTFIDKINYKFKSNKKKNKINHQVKIYEKYIEFKKSNLLITINQKIPYLKYVKC